MSLVWDDKQRSTIPPRFSVQRDNVRGEGPCYELWIARPEDKAAAEALNVETAFYGSHGYRRCQRIAQRIALAAARAALGDTDG